MFTHVTLATLAVRDQAKTAEFFIDKLGFEKRVDEPYGQERWVEVAPREGRTGIVLMRSEDEAAFSAPMTSVLFGCADIAAEAARLRELGVEVTDPASESWGEFILVTEPDGRQICVTQNVPTDTET